MKSDSGIKLKIEKDIPIARGLKGINKYPRIKAIAEKMQDRDSVIFDSYYHAAALGKYLKDLGFIAPIRTIRDDKGEREGWRVWAIKKEDKC